MAHAQQQILDAVQALLIAGATAAGNRVFVDLVDPLQPSQLPALLIQEDDGETSETVYLDGGERRELSVLISCVVTADVGAAYAARQLGLVVEKLVASSTTLAGLARGGLRITRSSPVTSGDGDRLLAAREQGWRFAYFVKPSAPDVFI